MAKPTPKPSKEKKDKMNKGKKGGKNGFANFGSAKGNNNMKAGQTWRMVFISMMYGLQ